MHLYNMVSATGVSLYSRPNIDPVCSHSPTENVALCDYNVTDVNDNILLFLTLSTLCCVFVASCQSLIEDMTMTMTRTTMMMMMQVALLRRAV